MDRNDEKSPAEIRGDYYGKDAIIKEAWQEHAKKDAFLSIDGKAEIISNERSEGARLHMAEEFKTPYMGPSLASLVGSYGPIKDVNQAGSLETLDQEKVRLTRELIMTISHNENVISTLREMLQRTEIHQKKLYYLRDSINQSSIVNHDHVMELRKVLGK